MGAELFDTADRELLVRVTDVGKRFGDFVALHPLNVKVYSGEFFGVFGPNGAGKSTFIKLLTGQLKPTMGQVEVLGIDVIKEPQMVKANIGIVPESESPPSYLTPVEFLQFVARLRGLDDTENRINYWIDWFGMTDKIDTMCKDLSKGQRQKVMCNWAENQNEIRLVIIKGAEPLQPDEGKRAKPNAFVAGADISEFTGKKSDDIRQSFKNNAWEAILNLSKPTIAMVDGFTLGGGLEVACSCDIRMVSSRSKFGTPEISLGLIPGGGGTQRLGHLIGYGKALELVLSGEMISADEALKIGLVNHVYDPDELLEATLKLARGIASKSPHTLKIAKKVVRASLELPISEGVALEAEEFAQLFDTEDKEI